MIKHHSNGKHRIADELKTLPSTAGSDDGKAPEHFWNDVQEKLVSRSNDFIRKRPGTSLLIAVAIGGVVGWLIKRRG